MLFFQIFRLTCKTLCLATGLDPKSGKLGTPPGAVMRGICLLIISGCKITKMFLYSQK